MLYHVYIMSSLNRTIYVGITSDLPNRVWQHKEGTFRGFTSKYRVNQLVYSEEFADVTEAIAREKQIKKWRREKKVALIEQHNPQWLDLGVNLEFTYRL